MNKNLVKKKLANKNLINKKLGLKRLILASLALIVLSACSYKPQQQEVDLELAPAWEDFGASQTQDSAADRTLATKAWWESFGSVELNQLIEQALELSPDLLIAQQRLRQAQASLGITQVKNLPELKASAGANTNNRKEVGASATNSRSSNLGVSTSYELDLWGRVSAEKHAAKATYLSAEFDMHASRLSLTAAVASSWFQWLAVQEQLTNAKWYLNAAQKQQQLVEAGFAEGVQTRVEVARQNKQVLSRLGNVKRLEQQSLEAKQALALLLGQSPSSYQPPAGDLLSLKPPAPHPGIPADLLSRRPDLASAEARLDAAAANVYQARKAVYPSLSLTGSASLASSNAVLSDPTQTLSLGANLSQSIFDFGAKRRQVELSKAQQEELVLSYVQSVYQALAEVEAALSNQALTQELALQQQELVATNKLISQQLEKLYLAGAEKLNNLLDAQQEELQAEDQLLNLYLNRLEASLSLYKALGGGWAQNP